jgi:hypothetical protein
VSVDCQFWLEEGKMKAQPNRKEWMSPFALNPTIKVIEVVCSIVWRNAEDVKALAAALVARAQSRLHSGALAQY